MSLKDAVKANKKEQLNELQKVLTFSENHSVHEVNFSTKGVPYPDSGYEATVTLSSDEFNKVISLIFSLKGKEE